MIFSQKSAHCPWIHKSDRVYVKTKSPKSPGEMNNHTQQLVAGHCNQLLFLSGICIGYLHARLRWVTPAMAGREARNDDRREFTVTGYAY